MIKIDAAYIAQKDVVQRYLNGRLSASEQVAFEAYILEHPDIVETIQLDNALKTGLAHLQQEKPRVKLNWQWLMPFVGVAMGAFATWFVAVPLLLNEQADLQGVSPEIVYVDVLRSAPLPSGASSEASISANARAHIVVMDVSAYSAKAFDLVLQDTNNNIMQTWQQHVANKRGELLVQVNGPVKATNTTLLLNTYPHGEKDVLMSTLITVNNHD